MLLTKRTTYYQSVEFLSKNGGGYGKILYFNLVKYFVSKFYLVSTQYYHISRTFTSSGTKSYQIPLGVSMPKLQFFCCTDFRSRVGPPTPPCATQRVARHSTAQSTPQHSEAPHTAQITQYCAMCHVLCCTLCCAICCATCCAGVCWAVVCAVLCCIVPSAVLCRAVLCCAVLCCHSRYLSISAYSTAASTAQHCKPHSNAADSTAHGMVVLGSFNTFVVSAKKFPSKLLGPLGRRGGPNPPHAPPTYPCPCCMDSAQPV